MRILAVNQGTSSLKFLVAEVSGDEVRALKQGEAASIDEAVSAAGDVQAVGHRVVHGGSEFVEPARLDESVVARLEGLSDLAPLHNPPAVAAIRSTMAALPGVPQFAVFDTAFHSTLPAAASTYAVPEEWRSRHGVRRYGFHGLAHRSMAESAARELGRPVADLRLVTLQLGSGASACAIEGGRSVDTSMGLTPAEGLVMATRSGDVDPLLVQYLVRVGAGAPDALWSALERESGLAGLAGEKDMKTVLERAAAGDAAAELAVDVFCHRLRHYIGAYLAHLGGADAIVFGGGVGENSEEIRRRATAGLDWSGARVLVCHVDEESIICRDVAAAVSSAGS